MSRIAIATYHSPDYEPLAEITLPNKASYCSRHGYELIATVYQGPAGSIGWERIKTVATLLPHYDAVMWIDCDAVICNMDHVLQPENGYFYASEDIFGINVGQFVATNAPIVHQFLYAMLAMGKSLTRDHFWSEQEAVIRFFSHPPYSRMIRVLDQHAMNSYLNEEYGRPTNFTGQYRPGDFILHLPGLSLERRCELAQEYTDLSWE